MNFYLSNTSLYVFWSVIVVTVSFLSYHFITSSGKFKKRVSKYFGKKRAKVKIIVIQRLLGLIFFGLIPGIVSGCILKTSLSEMGLNTYNFTESLKWIGIISPIILIMNYLNAGNKDNLAMYPQIRKKKWNTGLLVLSALSWITYLIGYEFMFRGFLLFNLYNTIGILPAITINTSIYALVHVPKGLKEAIGAIPLGIVLCILTLNTGSIIIALVVHIIMALSNEWFSLIASSKMKFVKK